MRDPIEDLNDRTMALRLTVEQKTQFDILVKFIRVLNVNVLFPNIFLPDNYGSELVMGERQSNDDGTFLLKFSLSIVSF